MMYPTIKLTVVLARKYIAGDMYLDELQRNISGWDEEYKSPYIS